MSEPEGVVSEPEGVLTADFPSAGEMLGWLYGHIWSWIVANPLLVVAGIIGLVLFYGCWVFRQAVRAV